MPRKTICSLSTPNLLHNLSVVRSKAPQAKIMAMVKANAYGHGLRSVALRLQHHVESFGVASIEEALALRQVGIQNPITLIEGVFARDELALAAEQKFDIVFHSEYQLTWLQDLQLTKKVISWLKINTGLGRLGFSLEAGKRALKFLEEHPGIEKPVGLMSHFACAENPDHALNQKQISQFEEFASAMKGPKSFCNSAALIAFPSMHFDWVRPGLALYGASPLAAQSADILDLRPVMTFQTELIAIQKLSKGDTVGYGATFTCPENMPVGIMAVGYGDGYPRVLGGRAFVRVKDSSCPVIGAVSMDMAAIDLRPFTPAMIGDCVTLWGNGLPIEDLARQSGRSSYDLMTGVQNRVKFSWID